MNTKNRKITISEHAYWAFTIGGEWELFIFGTKYAEVRLDKTGRWYYATYDDNFTGWVNSFYGIEKTMKDVEKEIIRIKNSEVVSASAVIKQLLYEQV